MSVFVYGQFVLFLAYGLVQTLQIMWMYYHRSREQKKEKANNNNTEDVPAIPELSKEYGSLYQDAASSWLDATIAYTVLNVLAKALLGICIIVISSDMSGGD